MTLSDAKDLAIIVGTIAAAFTFVKAVIEYTKQNAQKRAEHYTHLREEFKKDARFTDLFEQLENDSRELSSLAFEKKQDLIGFYEDIALAVNSRLMKKEVAHYMFAYYALRCWDSDNFWTDMNRDSHYWTLFRYFVREMKAIEEKFQTDPPKLSRFRL
jgi:alpha-D-ribose 1-methylphosphonate 5-triphosphate diphosphatase PhnM